MDRPSPKTGIQIPTDKFWGRAENTSVENEVKTAERKMGEERMKKNNFN